MHEVHGCMFAMIHIGLHMLQFVFSKLKTQLSCCLGYRQAQTSVHAFGTLFGWC